MEIPLHKLEQKVMQLETHVINYNIDEICSNVITKINQNLKTSIPKFWNDIHETNKWIDERSKLD